MSNPNIETTWHSEFIEKSRTQMKADLTASGVPPKEAELKATRYFAGARGDTMKADAVAAGRFQGPPLIAKDISTVKTWLLKLGDEIGISETGCDINLDRGHSYCRELYFHFARLHTKQTLESTYGSYEGARDEERLMRNYEQLSDLAQKERDMNMGKAKCRLMRTEVLASRLYVGELWSEKNAMWAAGLHDEEEEAWCTVSAAAESGQNDLLLRNEAQWMDIDDLARIEEVLDQTTAQYAELFLSHKDASFAKRKDSAAPGVDLTALDTLNKSHDDSLEEPPAKDPEAKDEKPAQEHESEARQEDWKHVIKSYLIERLLLHREYKRKIGHALNYFCSVQRRLTQDVVELSTSHTACEANVDVKASKPSTASGAASPSKRKSVSATVPPAVFHEASGQPLTTKAETVMGKTIEETRDEAQKRFMLDLKLVRIGKDEVRMRDHNGVYVFLQGAIEKLKEVMERIMQAGSYYILQRERVEGMFKKKQRPVVDRGLVLLDLLRGECEFQYEKVWAVEKLMFVYEHTSDFAEIQSVGQLIYDVISRRPRLHLVAEYFTGTYDMEAKCLRQYNSLLAKLIIGQVQEELRIDSSNAQSVRRKLESYHKHGKPAASLDSKSAHPTAGGKKPAEPDLPDPYRGVGSESHKKRLEEILELEPKNEADLFAAHQRVLATEVRDEELEQAQEFSSFQEGWHYIPPNESPAAEEIEMSTCPELPKCKIFAFYASLGRIVQVVQAAAKAVKAVAKDFQAESGFAVSALELEVLRTTEAEYERVQNFLSSPPESMESQLRSIEQAQAADSPEVLMFCVKELAATFTKKTVSEIDPTLLAKLPPAVLRSIKSLVPDPTPVLLRKSEQENNPKWWPTLLTLCCNLVELTRMREQLIESTYESHIVGEIYKSQQGFASHSVPAIIPEAIAFPALKSAAKDFSSPRLCDECKLNLPVKEFDPAMQNLLCFHRLDCLKHSLFDAGLEEVRGALHYQMMYMQLLQMATHMNHRIYLPYTRALAEIDGATGNFSVPLGQKKRAFAVPNGVLGLRVGEEARVYTREKENTREKMMRALSNCFVDISAPRYVHRAFVQSSFETFLAKLQSRNVGGFAESAAVAAPSHTPGSMFRALKACKIYLLHVYCDRTLKSFYEVAVHAHIFEAAQSLRGLAMMFPEDELLFDCRKSYGLESVPFAAGLSLGLDEVPQATSNKLSSSGFTLKDTLLRVPSTEDIAAMIRAASRDWPSTTKLPDIQLDVEEQHPEKQIKVVATQGTLQSSPTTKKHKKWLRNDGSGALLASYETAAFETLNGMMSIRNSLMLELAIEGTHVPVQLWLLFTKDFRMGAVPWKRCARKGSVLDPSPKADGGEKKESGGHEKVDNVIRSELYAEHRLEILEHLLRSVAHKMRVMDCALYKTCGYNTASVLDYFVLYYKYKYMCLAEGLFKLLDDVPTGNRKDECWTHVTRTLNHMLNTRLGTPTYVGDETSCFRFLPRSRLDLLEDSDVQQQYQGWYARNLVPERFDDPDILKIVCDDLQNEMPDARISLCSEMGEFPLSRLFIHIFGVIGNEEARKSLASYISIVEGKAQVEYAPQNSPVAGAEDSEGAEFFLLPVEVSKLEELREQVNALKDKIRLRRFRLALMSWYTGCPSFQNLDIIFRQRKVLTERTFISLMQLKEEIKFEADQLDLPRNQRLRKENLAETAFLRAELSKDLLNRGIECLKQEQAIISELIDKGTLTLESSMDCMRGTAATLYSNVDTAQRQCILNAMSQVQSFLSQIKNRSTLVESLTTGTAMIITLHDFNLSLYALCKNLWRQYVAQYRTGLWAERKLQQQLQHQAYMEGLAKSVAERELEATKKNIEHSIGVEVGQRCYEEVYEVERMQRQCQFWKQKMLTVESRARKELRDELQKEIMEKELQIKNYGTQFADYKETLMSQLKAEIASHNITISKKLQGTPTAPLSPKRGANNVSPSNAAVEKIEEEANMKVAAAYDELAKLQEKVHSLRLFYNMRMTLMKGKYREKMGLVRKHMSDNAELCNELSLAERREIILKQELVNTQRNMSGFERTLKQMQTTLKEKNEALLRFHQTKNGRAQRLEELEAKLRRCNASAGVDVDQLQLELMRKDKELLEMRGAVDMSSGQVESVKSACRTQMRWMQRKLKHEESEKGAAIQKVGELRTMMIQTQSKNMGKDPLTTDKEEGAGMWRDKCKELVEICKALKSENESLRSTLKDQSQSNVLRPKGEEEVRLDTPYSQGTISANFTRRQTGKGLDTSMNVIGTGSNAHYAMRPRPSVQTRASSQSGTHKSRVGSSRDQIPNIRPQTQHHPFFMKQGRRLNSSGIRGCHMQNLSYYPPSDTQ